MMQLKQYVQWLPLLAMLSLFTIYYIHAWFSDENDFSTYVEVNLPLGSAHYSYHASIAIQYWNTATS
jgi:hypothetical protein